jgi:hypothetical protein
MMQQLSRHVSPDGLLTLVVVSDETGDVALGFEGYAWHTHANTLAALSETKQEGATGQFVDALLSSRAVIGLDRGWPHRGRVGQRRSYKARPLQAG